MSEETCECVILYGREIERDAPVRLRLLRRCESCREKRKAAFLKRVAHLNSLKGAALLKELFGTDKEGALKGVAAGEVDRIPGPQNKRKGTAWRARHRVVKQSRRQNRTAAKHTLRRVQGRQR